MEKQISFSEIEFMDKRKRTRKEVFFEKMEKIVPLKDWCRIIEPYYYERGNGRPPIKLEIMLKMYLVSQWFNLSDYRVKRISSIYRSEFVSAYGFCRHGKSRACADCGCLFGVIVHYSSGAPRRLRFFTLLAVRR